jgi:hypothetical protein
MKGKIDREWIPFGYQHSAFSIQHALCSFVLASYLIAAFVLLTADG